VSVPLKPPGELQKSGREMWAAVHQRLDLDRHEQQVLLEACRVADRLDALAAAIRKHGVLLPNGDAVGALVEARQQQITLARLIASLRLPEDLNEPTRRPQRRGAARGTYRLVQGDQAS
jgi:hypothetical protein